MNVTRGVPKHIGQRDCDYGAEYRHQHTTRAQAALIDDCNPQQGRNKPATECSTRHPDGSVE